MFLKRIEINGFKSFANRTEILLNNRITGIVGPNGSGKSNISDAIRWVLGEQSSKNLRGSKMEDVIFNGTQSRAKKPFCEVSLIFDNENGRINSEYSEITITRRMLRNGESEYKINNNTVRLKDIIDITRDTGIGKEGYSIIGQGRIDDILASKPLSRRKVFEEAAGIMKYRARKEEAENKLTKTDDNLTRVEDILEELTSRIEPLKQQAEETRKYLTLFDRQRVLDATVFVLNTRRFSEKTQKLSKEISEIEAEINRITREFGDAATEGDKLNEELDNAIEQENSLNEQFTAINTEIERMTGELNLVNERINNIEAEAIRTREEMAAYIEIKNELEASVATNAEKLTEIDEEVAICDGALTELEQERSGLLNAQQAHSDELSRLKHRQLDIMSQKSSRTSELARLAAELEGAGGRRFDIDARLKRTNLDIEQRTKLISKGNERILGIKAEKNAVTVKVNESNMLVMNAQKEAESVEAEVKQLDNELHEESARLATITSFKKEYSGYNDSVRNLMKAVKQQPQLHSRIIGTVAELIRVPKEYETAIETYLGANLQNIVVEDEYDAKALIELLRKEKLGRVTFMPLKALKVTDFSDKEMDRLRRHSGFIASAYEVLSYDKKVAPAIKFLLSKTALTKDLDSSIKIMRDLEQSIKTVTLNGDINRPGGIMTGGSIAKSGMGLLSLERRINETQNKISRLEGEISAKNEEISKKNEQIAALKADSEALISELKAFDIKLAEERERIASFANMLEGAQAMQRSLNNQLAAIEAEEASIKEDIEKYTGIVDQLETEEAEIIEKLRELETGSIDNSKELNRLTELINDKRIRRAELLKEKQAFTAENERLNNELIRNNGRYEFKTKSLEAMSSQSVELTCEGEMLAEKIAAKRVELSEAKEVSVEVSERRKELRALVYESQKAVNDFQEQKTVLMERRVKTESQLERIQIAVENAETKLWEDYELTLLGAESIMQDDISYTHAVKEAEDIKAAIRELGSINPRAIEEYEEVSGRVEDMTRQKADLNKAKEDLSKVIDGLLGNMRTTFEDKFNQINHHFKLIFKELFGGGRAELIFEEGDILEAGIDIVAEPPGKKLQQLSLLSGGERALTAIALLFAMIKINPSPVCLLDEIDAPLDEANAVQFAEYLTKIKETQFMVITHRKPTMAACNALYGVAMEEKGVSRMVSVQIDK